MWVNWGHQLCRMFFSLHVVFLSVAIVESSASSADQKDCTRSIGVEYRGAQQISSSGLTVFKLDRRHQRLRCSHPSGLTDRCRRSQLLPKPRLLREALVLHRWSRRDGPETVLHHRLHAQPVQLADKGQESHGRKFSSRRTALDTPWPQVIGREQQPHRGDSFSLAATTSLASRPLNCRGRKLD
ncbi:hypothetical protein fugu_003836 [Takifugu bimaculatus]|uniref:Secreted protein n=1 Tax=Takifugu bimaculatus TaxID=433685 RepID=A0A4Z2BBR2_9TELE|nr:hypothetical protein fugu_003836 [Takifugu bimaculatus]